MQGLDLSNQNDNTCIIDISIEEFKINTYHDENGEKKITKHWNYSFNNKGHFKGKIAIDNIIIDTNENGLDFDYFNLPKEEYKGDLDNLKNFISKEFHYDKNNIQEIKEGNRQFFYMTDYFFAIRENNDINNFSEGDIRIEIITVRKFFFVIYLKISFSILSIIIQRQ